MLMFSSFFFLEPEWRPFLHAFQCVLHDAFSLVSQYGTYLLSNACCLSLLLSPKQLLFGFNFYSAVNSHV